MVICCVVYIAEQEGLQKTYRAEISRRYPSLPQETRSQAVARIADRTASQ